MIAMSLTMRSHHGYRRPSSLHKTGRRARQSVAAFHSLSRMLRWAASRRRPGPKDAAVQSALVSRGLFDLDLFKSIDMVCAHSDAVSISIAPRAAAVVDALLCLSFSIIAFLGLWLPVGDGQGSVGRPPAC